MTKQDILGFEGYYQITQNGDVFSLSRKVAHPRAKSGYCIKRPQQIKKRKSNKGVVIISLYKDTVKHEIPINRLVYENFIGDIPPGYYCHNKDGNPFNNNAHNIYLSTFKNYHKDNSL